MRLSPIPFLHLLRHLSTSSSSSAPSPLKLKNICYRHRHRALAAARSALVEYLHTTRSLPFAVAEAIASNSPSSLRLLLSSVADLDSPSLFPLLLRRHLSYRPVNELDFFSESIGLHSPLPSPSLFLSDHPRLLSSVSALSAFGFPWRNLGLVSSAFALDADYIATKLHKFEGFGFRRVSVIGICLAFPWTLNGDVEEKVDLLFRDLREVFLEYGMENCAGEDVEGVHEICRRIRVFYDARTEMGTIGELMGKNKRVFLEFKEEALMEKLGFFLSLGMKEEEVGEFVLRNVEIFDHLDLESHSVAMPEYLVSVGLSEEAVGKLCEKYPYVMGKNKLGNLPGILRAMNMREWFRDKVVNEGIYYLTTRYTSCNGESCNDEEKIEKDSLENMEIINTRKIKVLDDKQEFLFGIGFGENKLTSKAISVIHGTADQLRERFDCLIESGIEYSTLCRMINATPKLLNQSTESIQEKVNYLLNELGYPLEYLNNFPAFLCFDLENRIKPRYKIMNWLKEHGLLKKHFSPATVLANAERRFIINLYGIHPAAPKQWLETFSSRSDHHVIFLFQHSLYAT